MCVEIKAVTEQLVVELETVPFSMEKLMGREKLGCTTKDWALFWNTIAEAAPGSTTCCLFAICIPVHCQPPSPT